MGKFLEKQIKDKNKKAKDQSTDSKIITTKPGTAGVNPLVLQAIDYWKEEKAKTIAAGPMTVDGGYDADETADWQDQLILIDEKLVYLEGLAGNNPPNPLREGNRSGISEALDKAIDRDGRARNEPVPKFEGQDEFLNLDFSETGATSDDGFNGENYDFGANGIAGGQGIALPKYQDFYKRNLLHDYDDVTYHFTLSMLSEKDSQEAQQFILNGNENGPGFREWSSQNINKIIISETGSTVLNLANVEINATAGPVNNGKRLTGAVDFQMTMYQPLKASFTDTLVNAAISLGLPDGLKATYLLELRFIGRDPETGEIISSIPNTDRQFLIEIIAVEANVDSSGSSYNIKAVRSGDKGLRERSYKTDRPLRLSNLQTVNNLIDSIQESLNLNEIDKLAIEKGILDEYYVRLDSVSKQLIGNDPLLDTDTIENTTTNLGDAVKLDPLKKMFVIPQGTSIDRVLEFGITHSKKLQALAKGLKKGADANSSDSGDIDNFVKYIYKLKVDTKNIAWDVLRNEYAKEYHYTISLFPTLRAEILPGTWANSIEVAQKKVQALIDSEGMSQNKSRPYKALSKRYDYLFTGLNDKVLRFDIKYNNQFFFALHSYRGIFSKLDQSTHKKINLSTETLNKYVEQQGKVRTAWSDYLTAKADGITNTGEEQDAKKGELWSKFDAERQELVNLYVEGVENKTFEGDVKTAESLRSINKGWTPAALTEKERKLTASENSKNFNDTLIDSTTGLNPLELGVYAEKINQEDIAKAIDKNSKPFQIMWGAIPDDFRNKFNSDGQQPGKGHMDAVIESSLTDFEADLVAMDMDIKGDPFWLESERDPMFSDSASYYEGENYLLFRAITSAGEPDPETGIANPNREGNKEQMLNGVYAVVQIQNSFNGGQFIQNLKGVKEAFITDISILEQYKES